MGVIRQLRKSMKSNHRFDKVIRKYNRNNPCAEETEFRAIDKGRKLSEVLLDFIKPHMDPLLDLSEQEVLLQLGVLCWNLSFMPAEERYSFMKEELRRMKKDMSAEELYGLLQDIEGWVRRKELLFSKDRRYILEWHLEPGNSNRSGDFLSVVYHEIP